MLNLFPGFPLLFLVILYPALVPLGLHFPHHQVCPSAGNLRLCVQLEGSICLLCLLQILLSGIVLNGRNMQLSLWFSKCIRLLFKYAKCKWILCFGNGAVCLQFWLDKRMLRWPLTLISCYFFFGFNIALEVL